MSFKTEKPSEKVMKCREAVLKSLDPFKAELSGIEILAIISYTVGQVIAMQDQRTISPAMALDLVSLNIEAGNRDAIDSVANQVAGNG